MTAYFNRFSVRMTRSEAESASHSGDCTADVEELASVPRIARQLDAIGPEPIRLELKEYGAWDADELADESDNRLRIVWIAAGNITEEIRERERSKRHE